MSTRANGPSNGAEGDSYQRIESPASPHDDSVRTIQAVEKRPAAGPRSPLDAEASAGPVNFAGSEAASESAVSELRHFHRAANERLDRVFAAILAGTFIAQLVLGFSISGGAFSQQIQTLVFSSALLVCIPVAMVVLTPGAPSNQVVIGAAWSILCLVGSWAVVIPGAQGTVIRAFVGILPIVFLGFYPSPRAVLTAASIFVLADMLRIAGVISAPPSFTTALWISHAEWLAATAAGLALLGRVRRRMILELIERHLRKPSPTEDRLTRLPLRAEAVEFLGRCLGPWGPASATGGEMVGVIAIDIDRLKQINESLGSAAGDAVLRQAARRFSGCIRASDMLVRAGRDEFLVIVAGLADSVQAISFANRLVESMQPQFLHRGATVFATASFGLAVSPAHGTDPESLIHSAEQAVKEAKRCGRGNFKLFEPAFAPLPSYRQGLELDLHQAIARHELLLHYQPQYNQVGRVVCVEALLRWQHPIHGLVPPNEFIPLAEASGLILPIGEWVLGEACRQGADWIRSGLPPMRIAVNVSTVQFSRPKFFDKVVLALAAADLDARLLELEITETSLMLDHETACEKIARFQALGVTVSIDDFGMGYSSLAYLQQLPVNSLKVDRNFVTGIESSASALPLLAAIIMLAHSLNLSVVVEGVETEGQRSAIWSLGADAAQGYFFARPQRPEEVAKLFRGPAQLIQ